MIIKSLKLGNIRSYKFEEIDIPEGTVLLAGDIGTGKTTLLLAIEFALFGLSSELTGEALLNHAATDGFVELTFELSGKEFIVRRNLKRRQDRVRQDSGYIVSDGQRSELTPQELKAVVINLLGYPEDLVSTKKSVIFRYTVYTPQEEMRKIIGEGAETRLITLRKIFNIDKYKLARENASTVARSLRQEAKLIETSVALLPKTEAELEEYSEQLRVKHGLLASYSKSILQHENNLASLRQALDLLETKIKDETEIRKNEMGLKERIEADKSAIERIKAALAANDARSDDIKLRVGAFGDISEEISLEDLEKQLSEKEGKVLKLKQDEAALKVRFDGLKNEALRLTSETEKINARLNEGVKLAQKADTLKTIANQLEALKHEIEESRGEIEKFRLEARELMTRASEHKRVLQNLSSASTCPFCMKPLTQEHRSELSNERTFELGQIDERLSTLNETIRVLSLNYISKEKKQAGFQAQVDELGRIEGEISAMENLRAELNDKLHQLEACRAQGEDLEKITPDKTELAILESEVISLRKKQSELRTLELRKKQKEELILELNRLSGEKQLLKEEDKIRTATMNGNLQALGEFNARLSAMSGIENEYKQAKKQLELVQAEERRVSLLRAGVEAEVGKLNEYTAKLLVQINEMKSRKENLKLLSVITCWLDDYFSPLTENIERHVMLNIYQEFNELFVKWFSLIIEDPELGVRLDEEFSPIVVQNGFETTPEFLSGGERTSLALAYRLALNRVINDISGTINTKDIIILDEPTEGFSSEQLDNVRKVLEELNMRQVIIVSHESKIESFVENVIYIGKNENGSSVTKNSTAVP